MQMDSGQQSRRSIRKFSGVIALVTAALLTGCNNDDDKHNDNGKASVMQAAWVNAPVDSYKLPPDGLQSLPQDFLQNQTVRQLMRITAGGDGVRVRISNRFGTTALKVGSVYVAPSLGGGRIDPAKNMPLTFSGSTNVTIAAGQEIWSDIITMTVPNNIDLAVSMFLPEKALTETMHSGSKRSFFISNGNATTQADLVLGKFPINAQGSSPYAVAPSFWVTGIDVQNTTARGVVVSIGDSITDGTVGLDLLQSYPDFLAKRIAADEKLVGYSVVNSGIGGNRLLSEALFGFMGEQLLNRFERDALNVTGVSHIIVLIGINDLSGGVRNPVELQVGLQQLVDKAKAKNIKIFLGTVMPYAPDSPNEAKEITRQELNTWIRANHARANGIIDFDAELRDPTQPTQLLPLYDSGDRLHPNEVGYEAMSKAVDLTLLH